MRKLLIFHKEHEETVTLHAGVLREQGIEDRYVTDEKELIKILSQESIDYLLMSSANSQIISKIREFVPLQKVIFNVIPKDYEERTDFINNDLYQFIRWPYSTHELIAVLHRYERRCSTFIKEHILSHINALYEDIVNIENITNLKDKLQYSMEFISSYFKADSGSIMLFNRKGTKLRITASIGIDDLTVRESAISNGTGVAGWVTKNRKSLIVDRETLSSLKSTNIIPRKEITSSMVVLLEGKKGPLGVINLNSTCSRKFLQEDLRLLTYYAEKLSAFTEKMLVMQDVVDEFNELKETNKEMETFVYSAFHDLKTPLFTLEGFFR
ncbi:GAF domain-containing protein [bacterium]